MTRDAGRKSPDDAPLRLLASFPDVRRPRQATARRPAVGELTASRVERERPRLGWGSIAILALVAAASCGAAWWTDRGHRDPSAIEIQRIRVAERLERRVESSHAR
jgi:hypothetical protein